MPTVMLRNPTASIDAQTRVDREQFVIRDVAVIQRGPALGHGLEVDDTLMEQLAEQINAMPKGAKSRLSHPMWDGIDSTLGRVRNARVVDDKVRGDLHLGSFAQHSPQGDLRQYVMAIAEEDPELVGMSVAFESAEPQIELVDEPMPEAHKSTTNPGKYERHFVRSKELFAVDVVGDPAANSDGLFARAPITANKKESNMDPKLRKFLESMGLPKDASDSVARALLAALAAEPAAAEEEPEPEPAAAEEEPEPEPAPAAAMAKGVTEADVKAAANKAAQEALAAERARFRELNAMAKTCKLSEAWASEQIINGTSIAQAKDLALAEMAKLIDQQGTATFSGVKQLAISGDPETQWEALVAQHIAAGLSRPDAIQKAVRENTDLHRAYLTSFNSRKGRVKA